MHKPPCDEGVVRGTAAGTACTARVGRAVLAAAILGSSLAFIDGSAVNVALPALQETLGASIVDAQWVVEAYALTLAALMLTGGSLGDHYGRRRIYMLGLGLFAIASAWCGVAPDVSQLIAARAVQGVGGALLVPGSLALISSTFADEQRGRAIGTWAGATAITAAIGPVMGGWFTEQVSWRGIFFINLPLAAVALLILRTRVPEPPLPPQSTRLDLPGTVLASLGLGGIIFGLIESQQLGLTARPVLLALLGGTSAMIGFLVWERRSEHPMLPLRMFRSSTFSGANALTLLLYAGLGGALFYFPFNLIQVQGYSATAAGAAFVPFILIMFLLSRWAGGLVEKYGARPPLVVGPVIAALGFALFTLPGIGGTYWETFFPAVAVLGLGMAVSVAPLTTAVMNAVGEDRVGVASGVNNAVSRVAGLVAVAAMGMLLLAIFRQEVTVALSGSEVPQVARDMVSAQMTQMGAIDVSTLGGDLAANVRLVIQEAFVRGFRGVMWVAAALAALSALTAAFSIERDQAKS